MAPKTKIFYENKQKISMGANFWKEAQYLDGYILETVNS